MAGAKAGENEQFCGSGAGLGVLAGRWAQAWGAEVRVGTLKQSWLILEFPEALAYAVPLPGECLAGQR